MKRFLFIVHGPHILQEPPTLGDYALPSCSPSHECLCIQIFPEAVLSSRFREFSSTTASLQLLKHIFTNLAHLDLPLVDTALLKPMEAFQFRDVLYPFQNCVRYEEIRAVLIQLKLTVSILVSMVVGRLFKDNMSMRCSLIWCTPEETGCLVRITDCRLMCTGTKGENPREYTQSMRRNNRKPLPGHAKAEMLVRSALLSQVLELLSAPYCLCPLSSRLGCLPIASVPLLFVSVFVSGIQ